MFCISLDLDNFPGSQSHTSAQVHRGKEELLHLSPSNFLMKASLMTPLMVPMMAFLWSHKWKLYLDSSMVLMKASLIAPLMVPMMVPMMALLWINKLKLYLDS